MRTAADLKTNLKNSVSLQPAVGVTAQTVNGDAVDCEASVGPVYGSFSSGSASGSPTAQSHTCKLQESADGSTGWADLATQSSLILTANKSAGLVRGTRTKKYVRCVAVIAFTGGTSPAQAIAGNVLQQKQNTQDA